MAVNLNLLPPELTVSKSLSNLLKTLRGLGVIAIAVFIVFALGVGAFFIISTLTLGSINADINKLKNQVAAEESTEQSIVLVKDRLAKIVSIQNQPNSLSNVAFVKPLLAGLTAGTSINQLQIDSAKIDMALSVNTNSELAAFFSSLESSTDFKNITLSSFSFAPANGYSIDVSLTKK